MENTASFGFTNQRRAPEQWMSELKMVGISALTPEQQFAFHVLESQGFRFLVHFGVQNCVDRADQLSETA